MRWALPPGAAWASSQAAVAAACGLLAVALWMPPLMLQRPTVDYLVTFDITQSMDVEDMPAAPLPRSRLAAARDAMRETLRRLPCGSRLGWAVFADYRVMPLTVPVEVCSHYDELLGALDLIDGRMRWANASNVGKGVSWAVRSAAAIGPHTHVVFFSDGQESPPLREGERPPLQGITPGKVRGWVVGVGGELPARIPRTDRDGHPAGYWAADDVVQRRSPAGGGSSHEHLSELREPHLQALAKMMGLGYQRLTTPQALAAAMQSPELAEDQPVPTDLRGAPALLALLLLAWRFRYWPVRSRA